MRSRGKGKSGEVKNKKSRNAPKTHEVRPAPTTALTTDSDDSSDGENGNPAGAQVRSQRAARRGETGGMRQRRQAPTCRQDAGEDGERPDPTASPEEGGGRPREPLSRLQRMKQAKEREREALRQAHEAEQVARRQKREEATQREAKRAESEEEWEARENAALEELREAKRKQEDEEYAKWVGQIAVDERGELQEETHRRREAVVSFLIQHANEVDASVSVHGKGPTATSLPEDHGREDGVEKPSNILVLQDTSRQLQVSVEELVSVIEQLIREDRLFGVFDDRGKFVVMSERHFPMIAKFITQRGRVSVTELARECNRIILNRGSK
ncbi:unnamed protein product [Phytomonas sp. EM1]|nr:unnamed protein product [Phytomonas sp. EM1]|eukprot:CCW64008.1 unnamed protein product [Phytomonas sp. isolate EM1]